jgi:hypothetical protein
MVGSQMNIIDGAMFWAEAGVPVFPCAMNKVPLTSNGFYAASCDTKEIKRMFEPHGERCLIGARMGKESGMFAMDFDLYKGDSPKLYMEELLHKGLLPDTRVHRTMKGGLHMLYSHETSWPSLVPVEGVEVKGEGGYIIVPPSKGYTVHSEGVVEAPQGLLDILQFAVNEDRAASIAELKLRVISGKEFHDSLRNLAAKFMAQGHDVVETMKVLMQTLNESVASNPNHPRHKRWQEIILNDNEELTRLVKSGYKKYSPHAGTEQYREAVIGSGVDKIAARIGFFSPPEGTAVEQGEPKEIELGMDGWPSIAGYFADENHDIADQTFVMYPIYAEQETTVLFANPKEGKTAFNVTASLHVACGLDFGDGLKVTEQRPCVYYALEGGRAIKLRITAWRKYMKEQGIELPEKIPMFVVERPTNFLKEETRKLACDEIVAMDQYFKRTYDRGIGIISIDTLTKAMPAGDQNSVDDTSALFDLVGMLREAGVTASIVFVHHKARTGGVRGSTNIEAEPDVLLDVAKDGPELVIEVSRARSIEEGAKFLFKTQGYDLGVTKQGLPLKTFVVVPTGHEDAGSDHALTEALAFQKTVMAMAGGFHDLFAVLKALKATSALPNRLRNKLSTSQEVQDYILAACGDDIFAVTNGMIITGIINPL